jgi:hypothetical protein
LLLPLRATRRRRRLHALPRVGLGRAHRRGRARDLVVPVVAVCFCCN